MIKRIFRISPIALACLYVTSVCADFNDGAIAYASGDYGKAYNIMISLASATEDRLAKYYLGMMYEKGQGTERDPVKAAEWFRGAAEQALPQAQYRLARLYEKGQGGVPRDFEKAYAWYKTAALAHQHSQSQKSLAAITRDMSEKEKTEAEKLAKSYIEKYAPKPEKKKQPNVQLDKPA